MAKKAKTENEVEQTDAPATNADAPAEKKTKSIVPSRYAGRYKGGGSDALAEFIKEESNDGNEFSFEKFFELCRVNGLPEDKVAHYEAQVAEKRPGAPGRARMTLRNMLATIARKGSIKKLNGDEVKLDMPKPTLSGAAKAAKDKEGPGAEAGQQF